jgi:hypothetical protein
MNEPLSIQQQVESVIAPLVGMPLWDAGRAADLLWLAFGQRQTIQDFRGNPREVGDMPCTCNVRGDLCRAKRWS